MKERLRLSLGFSLLFALFAVLIIAHSRTKAMVNTALPASDDAKTTYGAKCAECHGKDGRAKSLHAKHVHARNFTDATWQNDVTDERLFNSISNGKGKMPSFKKKLSEDQINSLVTYVRHFKG